MSPRLVFIVTLLGVLPAHRAAAEKIAIVDFRHVNVPATLADTVRAYIHSGFVDQGYRPVISEERVTKKMQELGVPPGCTLGPCLARIGQILHVDRAVTGGISAQGSSYDLSLTLLETGGGTVLAQVNQRCDVCTFKEVEQATRRAIVELDKQARAYLATRAVLTVTSTPPSAEVRIDGVSAGKTPLTLVVLPGRHTVEARSGRERAARREVALLAGKTSTLALELPLLTAVRRVPPPPLPPRKTVPSWLKWAALGAGVAVAGAGGALLGIDGRVKDDERYVYDTRAGGITLVSLGAAAALSSVALYFLERRGDERPAATTAAHGR